MTHPAFGFPALSSSSPMGAGPGPRAAAPENQEAPRPFPAASNPPRPEATPTPAAMALRPSAATCFPVFADTCNLAGSLFVFSRKGCFPGTLRGPISESDVPHRRSLFTPQGRALQRAALSKQPSPGSSPRSPADKAEGTADHAEPSGTLRTAAPRWCPPGTRGSQFTSRATEGGSGRFQKSRGHRGAGGPLTRPSLEQASRTSPTSTSRSDQQEDLEPLVKRVLLRGQVQEKGQAEGAPGET